MVKVIQVYGVFTSDGDLLSVKKTMAQALRYLDDRRSCGMSGSYVAKCFLSREVGFF